ncbi:uncharacterized protein F5147DRAFT_650355 [Suillus discolor]|uniref:Uncharacterized protein n=1 Tax=Suillus discolor TaxID=1912936 RepID=A0A9P7FDI6_9AGAM|nr:uncharacterized protein F5147DRAFT_650355 [Suillus discolor]KAG2113413.1 hypothetical protein F5147DRAFT_650355 [Suillus discolor]
MSHTCQCMRVLGHEVVHRRLTWLLEPFARHRLSTFLSALKDAEGVITGSTVWAMVEHDEDYIRRDLNIIVPYRAFAALHRAVEDMLGFTPISSVPHPALAPSIGRFCRYACHERFITLSASHEGESVLHIILNAPTTADMLFMTTGGVCHTGDLVPQNKKLGCASELNDEFEVETGTAWLGRSCGNLCPTYWHHVEERHLRASIDWNAEDSVTNVFHNIDIEWRLNTVCINLKCPHRVEVMSLNFEGVGARNRNDVKFILPEIRCRKPKCRERFMQIIKGVFYGAGCSWPFLVPIPVRDGVERSPTLDDLDVSYWVKQRDLYECTVTRHHLCRTFSRVPGFNVTMDGKYTLYFEKRQPSMAPSRVLRRMGSMGGCREALHGSVVLVKQTGDTPDVIVDMTKRDQLMANFLISSLSRQIPHIDQSVSSLRLSVVVVLASQINLQLMSFAKFLMPNAFPYPSSLPTVDYFCLRRRQVWFYLRLPQAGAFRHSTLALVIIDNAY